MKRIAALLLGAQSAVGVDIDPSVYTLDQAKGAILAKLGREVG